MASTEGRARAWSEAELHRWLHARAAHARGEPGARGPLVGSFGHDAAVLRAGAGRPVLCVDQTIEGVHFEPGTEPRDVGAKAAARALSDLAATAAEPLALLLALAAPHDRDEAWLRTVIEAVDGEARRHGAALVGGDLAATSGPASLAVSAFGRSPGRRRPPGRDRARAGQVLLLTGPVGGSRLGRHLALEPRLDEGRWLWERGATALMDVSDGLALDLTRLAAASGVRLELDDVPVHADARRAARRSGGTPLEHALTDGEDHELIATLATARWRAVEDEARGRFPALVPIGHVRHGAGVWMRAEGDGPLRRVDPAGGWIHGG